MTPQHMSFEVKKYQTGDYLRASVMCVMGDIDLTTASELRAAINRLLVAEPPARLILDLHCVAHIDSSGVGTLLEALRGADRRQVDFLLCGLNNAAQRMLERTRLNLVFDIRPSLKEALRGEPATQAQFKKEQDKPELSK